jgi:hypothetical protein
MCSDLEKYHVSQSGTPRVALHEWGALSSKPKNIRRICSLLRSRIVVVVIAMLIITRVSTHKSFAMGAA